MQRVEHLIIGAGVAGLTLRHLLGQRRVAVVDPNPGGYKIGESLIPELFRHPELAALVPRLSKLPSYTPKYGTTFLAHGEVAYFPVGEREVGEAMHIARTDLEQEMARAWNIEVDRSRVEHIDWETKTVSTSGETYRVDGLVLDCSGPAMVVSRSLDEVEVLRPAFATWAYYDIVSEAPERFEGALEARGWRYLKYDVRLRQPLASHSARSDAQQIVATTFLSLVDDGLWTWQIPLFSGTRLSLGVVSRDGPVSLEQYREVAERNVAPHFEIRRRAEDGPSPFDRVHTRAGIARRARRAADRDFILLADAYGFSDPVYSVGAGLAATQAIEVARMLTDEVGWTKARCDAWEQHCRHTLERATRAFDYWYDGAVINQPAVSAEVADFLTGGAFQSGISEAYGAALDLATLDSERDAFEVSWDEHGDRVDEVASALELGGRRTLADWTLVAARPCAGGLQLRWTHAAQPELIMLAQLDEARGERCFRRAGPFALSYMQPFEGRYPVTSDLHRLYDTLASRIAQRPTGWFDRATARV